MGCFSYMCKECDKGILSNSYSGQECVLFLLKDGDVMQRMEGQYDSYGTVFIKDDENGDSHEWAVMEWGDIVDMHYGADEHSGIAAVHKKCFKSVPTTRSASDPYQGWGEDGEYFADTDEDAVYD